MKTNPEWFMSDLAPQYYDAFVAVNQCHPKQLFCTWHIDKAWRKELREKIGNIEIYNQVYKKLRIVLEEVDPLVFNDKLNILLNQLKSNPTQRFLQYFVSYWLPKKEKWAYCYRLNSGINTNMYVEAFHRVFKYEYLKGKVNKRVDRCIHMLLQYDRNKAFDRIVKLTKGKSTQKLKMISERHQAGLTIPLNTIYTVDDGWKVKSQSQDQLYEIKKCRDDSTSGCCTCKMVCNECKVCLHEYTCTCNDFLLRTTICKHIHSVKQFINKKSNLLQNIVTSDVSSNKELDDFVDIIKKKEEVGNMDRLRVKAKSLLSDLMMKVDKAKTEEGLRQLVKSISASKSLYETIEGKKQVCKLTPTINCSTNKHIETQRSFFSTKKRKKLSGIRFCKPNNEDKAHFEETPKWYYLKGMMFFIFVCH